MAKLALFLPDLAGGGAERSFINLAKGLADRGHTVDLVVSRMSGQYADQVPSSIRLINLGSKSTLLSPFRLAAYIRRENPAALYAALDNANLAAIWAKKLSGRDIPVIVSIRNNLSQFRSNATGFEGTVMPRLIKMFYPVADQIVAVSSGVADDCAQMTSLPRNRVAVIYNPVVSDDLFVKAAQPIDHPWLEAGELPVILAAGRMNSQKDFPTLIRAFASVAAKAPSRLIILGEGDHRSKLTALVDQLGLADIVSMPGFAQNPYGYMSKARLFVLSSLHEGLPGVVIQALACGCPVVSTDCPSGPSEILQNGKYGKLVPIADPDALASAMLEELSQPKTTPPAESWEPYLFDTASRQYEEIAGLGIADMAAPVAVRDYSIK